MSVIQERLQQRDFISLYDLLRRISTADGCTLQEAAAIICQLLAQEPPQFAPKFAYYSMAQGLITPRNTLAPQILLEHVASHGGFKEKDENDIPF